MIPFLGGGGAGGYLEVSEIFRNIKIFRNFRDVSVRKNIHSIFWLIPGMCFPRYFLEAILHSILATIQIIDFPLIIIKKCIPYH